jgi:hypothetical protein
MTNDTSTSSSSPPPSSTTAPAASAEKKALLAAFDTVLKSQAEEREATLRDAEARRRARARPLFAASALIVLGLGAYLAIVQPTWVFSPRPTPETLALKEASLRISMVNASQHLHRFQQRNGRLPETLAEAGAHDAGLSYQRLGASAYRLVGDNGPAHVTLSSEEELAGFLGNSYQIIARRPK